MGGWIGGEVAVIPNVYTVRCVVHDTKLHQYTDANLLESCAYSNPEMTHLVGVIGTQADEQRASAMAIRIQNHNG